MKSLIRNTISIAALVALGLSGCTQSDSEVEYKNVSQDNVVTRSADEHETSSQTTNITDITDTTDTLSSSHDVGGAVSQNESINDIYLTLDSVVEENKYGLAYSEDRSTLFMKYDPEISLLYLQFNPNTNARLNLDSFIYGFAEYDTLNNPQIERREQNSSEILVSSTDEARAILEIMPEIYSPSLYQESAFNPDIIRFGYESTDSLEQYVQETERYPINDSEIRQRAITIIEELPDEMQDNPYHVLAAVQDSIREHEESAQEYVALARTYGIPAREVEAYTATEGPRSLAMVYLDPYGWMLTDPQTDDNIRDFSSDDRIRYYFRIGTDLEEKGVSIYPLTTDVRHTVLDQFLEDIMLYRHQQE